MDESIHHVRYRNAKHELDTILYIHVELLHSP